jgi:hypothetical protein
MSTTTAYDVLLRYRLDNQASKNADDLAKHLEHASHAGEGLGGILGHIGAIAGGYFGIHGAWEHLVKFNAEVENAKISLTAMMEGGFGGSFQWARGQAEAMYSEFQKFSQQTPMTTQEMLEFGRGVAMATQQAGGSIQDIINVTEQGAVAAKAYGFEASLASREISEMLQGNIRSTEPFTKALAGAGHKSLEELRAMNKEQRLEWLKTTLNSPALKDAVSQMSGSFAGVSSTLIDKVQILLGRVGLPLFKAITAEVGRWNEWIDKNQISIDHMATTVAQGLVTAFNDVKEVFQFIWEHADAFIAIGKVWAAIKIGNMIGGGLLGGGGAAGLLGSLGSDTAKLGTGTVMQGAMLAGMGGYEIGKMMGLDGVGQRLGEALHPAEAEFDRLARSTASLDQAMADAQTRMGGSGEQAASQGVIDDMRNQANAISSYLKAEDDLRTQQGTFGGDIWKAAQHLAEASDVLKQYGIDSAQTDEQLAAMLGQYKNRAGDDQVYTDRANEETRHWVEALERSSLTDYQRQTLNETRANGEVFSYMLQHLRNGIPIKMADVVAILKQNSADPDGKHTSIADKPKVNVTIHRIEVQSDDPDRFVFGMMESFRDAAKNPSSALSTLREG